MITIARHPGLTIAACAAFTLAALLVRWALGFKIEPLWLDDPMED